MALKVAVAHCVVSGIVETRSGWTGEAGSYKVA